MWRSYVDQGADVLICGDFNTALGNQAGMTRNDESVNKSGEMVLKADEDLGLHVLNKMERGCQKTHVDRSAGTDRALDYIISNKIDTRKEFLIQGVPK